MRRHKKILTASALTGLAVISVALAQPPTGPVSFFVTSVGMGHGANFGSLENADKHCQTLAEAVGAGNRTAIWGE